MTQPIGATAKAMPNIQVTLVSSGQVCLHLKYATLQLGLDRVGVAAMISRSPRDDGTVILHGCKAPMLSATWRTPPVS